MGESGRFIVSEVSSIACKVIGVRSRPRNMVYINDGVYGNFMNALIEPPIPSPTILNLTIDPVASQASHEANYEYMIWGRTCDSTDKVIHDCKFRPPLRVHDWLLLRSMGGKCCQHSYQNYCSFVLILPTKKSTHKRHCTEVLWFFQRDHDALH